MIRLLAGLLGLIPFALHGQFAYVLEKEIPVEEEAGVSLRSPWVGGLNTAQYSTMDLNQDAREDLVLFDRMAQRVMTFINVNNQYEYAPEYEILFPARIMNWLLLRDYNCDGKKDIFTGDNLGIRVFTNTSDEDSVTWEPYLFYPGPGATKDPILLTQGLSGKVNVQMQFDDLPSLEDLDGDGDLDILNVRYGGGTVELNKNFSKELYGTCDSLEFKLMTQTWGNFTECTCGTFAFHGESCSASGRVEHAGGKSLLAIDENGDAQPDLLISEAECTHVSLLVNEGDPDAPQFNSFSLYPQASPADILQYPAAYHEDVDFDGKKDLMVTPNFYSKEHPEINLWESNWFYKNTGTNNAPQFSLVKKNFLQETMLDVGDNAVPAFGDFDADGDYDLFISNNNFPATIRVYENVGGPVNPDFKFHTADYAMLSQQSFRNLKIQFADVNRDRRSDLVFTATASQTGVTSLYYIINNRGAGAFDFAGPVQQIPLSMTASENILMTHVDRDNNIDVLLAKSNGALEFWRNEGALNFSPRDDRFLGLGPNLLQPNLTMAAGDLNADGKADLILAGLSGTLRIISDFKNAADVSNAATNIVYNERFEKYWAPNLGGKVWPAIVNLYGTLNPAIVAGTTSGGVRILKNNAVGGSEFVVIQVYPNPRPKNDDVNILVNRPAKMQVYSMKGEQLTAAISLVPNQVNSLNEKLTGASLGGSNLENDNSLHKMASGMYVLRFIIDNKYYSRRLVVH